METNQQTRYIAAEGRHRNWKNITLSGLSAVITGGAAYLFKNRFLADDVFWKRKSSEKLDDPELFALRDTIRAENKEKSVWGKITSHPGNLSTLSNKIAEKDLSWFEAFKKQSGISKAATLMLATAALVHAYVFVKELIGRKLYWVSEDQEPTAQTPPEKPQHQTITQEEAQLLAEKQATAKKEHGTAIEQKRKQAELNPAELSV